MVVNITKIYFAHSYSDYDTEYEHDCIKTIKLWCRKNGIKKYWLINPKDVCIDDIDVEYKNIEKLTKKLKKDIKIFYGIIDYCDILVAAKKCNAKINEDLNYYSICVKAEIKYAKKKNIKVYDISELKSNSIFDF